MNEDHKKNRRVVVIGGSMGHISSTAMALATEHNCRSQRVIIDGDYARERTIALHDHKKLSTRKQRMKEAMRRAAMGEK